MYADLMQDLARVLRQGYGKNVMMATLHFELATITANYMALMRTLRASGLINDDLLQTYSIEAMEELVQKFAERLNVPKDTYRTKGDRKT